MRSVTPEARFLRSIGLRFTPQMTAAVNKHWIKLCKTAPNTPRNVAVRDLIERGLDALRTPRKGWAR